MHIRRILSLSSAALMFSLWGLSTQAQTLASAAPVTPGQFAVTQTGAATYSIPIQVPPGVAAMTPKLELVYNSQRGNGMLGMGWALGGLSAISRCPKTIATDGEPDSISLSANDRFCLDGKRLILVDSVGNTLANQASYGAANTLYRTELETFSTIQAFGAMGSGPQYFVVKTKDGLTMEYGNTADSRALSQTGTVVRTWALNKVTDRKANVLTVTYVPRPDNTVQVPLRISYGGNTTTGTPSNQAVNFAYDATRIDKNQGYVAGSLVQMDQRLTSIKATDGVTLVKEYRLGYAQGTATQRSKLNSITECDGLGACLPDISLLTTDSAPSDLVYAGSIVPNPGPGVSLAGDFNGDGKADILIKNITAGGWQIYLANADGSFRLGSTITEGPYSMVDPRIADFNGDGNADILINIATVGFWTGIGWQIYLSNGDGTFRLGSPLGAYAQWLNPQVADFNGDGKADILIDTSYVSSNTGWQIYLSNGDGSFRLGSSLPASTGWVNPLVADFNGDGKADILINTGAGWVPYLSNGDGTFRPGSLLANSAQSVRPLVADFNGDGKADILIDIGNVSSNTGWQIYLSNGDGSFRVGGQLARSYGLTNPLIADFNGDGKADILIDTLLGWQAFLSNGDGSFRLGSTLTPYAAWTTPQVADFNGDGKADILINTITTATGAGWQTYLSNGDGSFRFGLSLTPYAAWTTPQVADFNGDGRSDVLINTTTAGAGWYTYVSPQGLPDLLNSVSTGLGNTTTIGYQPITNAATYTKDSGVNAAVYPKVDLQFPAYVVSTVQQSNGIGGTNGTSYTYGGLKAELVSGRGMLGFRWTENKEDAIPLTRRIEYRQDFPFTGMAILDRTDWKTPSLAKLIKLTSWTSDCKIPQTAAPCAAVPGNRYFTYVSSSLEESWDLNGLAYPSTTTTITYNPNAPDTELRGDPSRVVVSTSDGSSKTTVNEYWPADTSNWISGLLKKSTVTSVKP
jgi:hypothetical protein